VDVGDPAPRTVVSAITSSSSCSQSIDALTDQLAVLLCNVKPVAVRGVQSHALLLTAYNRSTRATRCLKNTTYIYTVCNIVSRRLSLITVRLRIARLSATDTRSSDYS